MTLRFKGNIKTAGTLKGNAGSAAPATLLGMIESLGLDNADLTVVLDGNDPTSLSNFESDGKWLNVAPGADVAHWLSNPTDTVVETDSNNNSVIHFSTLSADATLMAANSTTWQTQLAHGVGDSYTIIMLGASNGPPATSQAVLYYANRANGQTGTMQGNTSANNLFGIKSGSTSFVTSAVIPYGSDINFIGCTLDNGATNSSVLWINDQEHARGTVNLAYSNSALPLYFGGGATQGWHNSEFRFNAIAVWKNKITDQNVSDLYNLLASRIS